MGKPGIKREKLILKAEDYMLRGYDRPTELAQLLDVAYNTAREYVDIVKARWQIQGDPTTREMARAELIKKAEEVAKEGWVLKSNAKNTLEKVSSLRVVLHAIERLTKLRGLDVNHEDSPVIMSLEIQRHRQVMLMADQLNQLPPAEKEKAKEMLRAEIKKRKANKKKGDTAKVPEI
jgi:hypothetical protein